MRLSATSTITVGVCLAVVLIVLLFLVAAQVGGSESRPLHLTLAEGPDTPTLPHTPTPAPTEPPASGAGVGYLFQLSNPRAQTTDLSITAHHTAIIVRWSREAGFEASATWPAPGDDWVSPEGCDAPCGYRALAFTSPAAIPRRIRQGGETVGVSTIFETQHSLVYNGTRFHVVISMEPVALVAQLATLEWEALQ